jgi:hypothetical protein
MMVQSLAAGAPPSTIIACTIPTEGAPSLPFLQEPALSLSKGGWRCCVCYLILLWTRDQTHLAPAFPTPALRKKREGTGHPLCW